ncbi:hypothetical protein B0H14DRAFT_3636620 [Mycena olivaceomarginata]|nr:hypothetical protein B0H14DRAFT_3636620 [Mycena olivaceomarginata]
MTCGGIMSQTTISSSEAARMMIEMLWSDVGGHHCTPLLLPFPTAIATIGPEDPERCPHPARRYTVATMEISQWVGDTPRPPTSFVSSDEGPRHYPARRGGHGCIKTIRAAVPTPPAPFMARCASGGSRGDAVPTPPRKAGTLNWGRQTPHPPPPTAPQRCDTLRGSGNLSLLWRLNWPGRRRRGGGAGWREDEIGRPAWPPLRRAGVFAAARREVSPEISRNVRGLGPKSFTKRPPTEVTSHMRSNPGSPSPSRKTLSSHSPTPWHRQHAVYHHQLAPRRRRWLSMTHAAFVASPGTATIFRCPSFTHCRPPGCILSMLYTTGVPLLAFLTRLIAFFICLLPPSPPTTLSPPAAQHEYTEEG